MKLPSGNTLLQFQIGLVIALALVWWVTWPPEAPEPPEPINEFAPSPEIFWGDGQNEIRSSAPMAESTVSEWRPTVRGPEWLSHLDLTKPECRELKQEILNLIAVGRMPRVIHIGDCDKRLQTEDSVE